MATSARTPAALLAHLVASDPGRPRVTVYDDTDGPTRGERVELSARVLANWVAKAANLLQDDLDAGPGTTVRLALPPHWRTLYWAFAAWSVGACVDVRDDDGSGADVLVTDDPGPRRGRRARRDRDPRRPGARRIGRGARGGRRRGAGDRHAR